MAMNKELLTKDQRIWVVIDEEGQPDYCASFEQACHDHINEAIEELIVGAERWVVRPYLPEVT